MSCSDPLPAATPFLLRLPSGRAGAADAGVGLIIAPRDETYAVVIAEPDLGKFPDPVAH